MQRTTDVKVCAIIENKKGEILLQKWDEEPELGKWVPFGGFVENGESGIQALEREILEELNYRVNRLSFFKKFRFGDVEQLIYIVKDTIKIKDLELREGSDMKFFSSLELGKTDIGFNYRFILDEYIKCRDVTKP